MKEKIMKSFINQARNEEGSVLIVALLILVLLTLIGISATTTTNIEMQVAGNEKFHKIAFYHADSGVFAIPKLISACLDNGAEQAVAGLAYMGSSGTFFRGIMGFDEYDDEYDDEYEYDSDRGIKFTLGGFDVNVNVNRRGQQTLAGGGVEFASGAEGIGPGAGGVAILYDMDSSGEGPNSSFSNVGAVYRKVPGVPGGL